MSDTRSALVVEDDADLRTILSVLLQGQGFRVLEAGDGEAALAMARADLPDIVLLDVHLPGIHGPEVCRRLRTFSDVPVLFLTGATDDTDELVGFAAGGDDYVHKPFTPQLLLARVASLVRRGSQAAPERGETVVAGDVRVDLTARTATVGSTELDLTRTEYDVLALLAENAGRIISRPQLLEAVWGAWFGDDHVIDVTLSRLRHKLGRAGAPTGLISTHRGLGYRFNAD